jgi:hypothetical protein
VTRSIPFLGSRFGTGEPGKPVTNQLERRNLSGIGMGVRLLAISLSFHLTITSPTA